MTTIKEREAVRVIAKRSIRCAGICCDEAPTGVYTVQYGENDFCFTVALCNSCSLEMPDAPEAE